MNATKGFTADARQAFEIAIDEAYRLNHNFVGTEHILLGLIALKQGFASSMLRRVGIDLESVAINIEKLVGRGVRKTSSRRANYTPRARKVIALAHKEAKRRDHSVTSTGHILLGLLLDGEGIAAAVLAKSNVGLRDTQDELSKESSKSLISLEGDKLPARFSLLTLFSK